MNPVQMGICFGAMISCMAALMVAAAIIAGRLVFPT